jgi:putative oxidoreductase
MMQLHRLFSAFPAGFPGLGLLLLRVVVAAALVGHGILCLLSSDRVTLAVSLPLALILVSGVCLLIGFLTPILSLLAGLESLGIAFSWGPLRLMTPFESKLALLPVIAIAAAIALLGPGAFSIDARLFGWKEIVIPPASRPPQE